MIQWFQYSSKAIKGFPMKDPHERSFPVYVPPSYNAKRAEPYPLIFLLAGWGSRSSKYISEGSVLSPSLPKRLDEAIANSEIPAVIIAFPDASSRLGGSQYLNSPSLGNYSDYLCDELVEFLDSEFHTYRSPEYRGIGGHSSGGFGALINGFTRPDRFQFVCSAAGDTCFELSLLPGAIPTLAEIAKSGGIANFIAEIFKLPDPGAASRNKMEALMTLSLAPCYAPNTKLSPLFGEVFFDLRSGELIEEIWKKYLAWDPVRFIESHSDSAKKLKFVHLDAGMQDEYALQWGHRQLAAKLKKYGIPYQLDEFVGTHSGHHWKYFDRIKLMLQKMALKPI